LCRYQTGEFEDEVPLELLRWPLFVKGEAVDWHPGAGYPIDQYYSATVAHVQEKSLQVPESARIVIQKYSIKLSGDGGRIVFDVEQRRLRRQYKHGTKGRSCLECENCLREDCRTCSHCLDAAKYGGANKLKQRCKDRFCLNKLSSEAWYHRGAGPIGQAKASASRVYSRKKTAASQGPRTSSIGPSMKGLPKKNAWVKVFYEESGGWMFGQVTQSFPDLNEIEVEYENGDFIIEPDVLDSEGKLVETDIQVSNAHAAMQKPRYSLVALFSPRRLTTRYSRCFPRSRPIRSGSSPLRCSRVTTSKASRPSSSGAEAARAGSGAR